MLYVFFFLWQKNIAQAKGHVELKERKKIEMKMNKFGDNDEGKEAEKETERERERKRDDDEEEEEQRQTYENVRRKLKKNRFGENFSI